jgi:hypothetical protein
MKRAIVQKCAGTSQGRFRAFLLTLGRRIWQYGATEKGGGPKVCDSLFRTPEVVRR